LCDQAGTAGADGEANGNFVLAACGASQEKIGEIDASDEKNEADSGEQDQEFGAKISDDVLLGGNEAERPACGGRILVGELARELSDERVELSLRLGDGKSGFEAPHGAGKKSSGADYRSGKRRGAIAGCGPQVDISTERATRMAEAGRHDADDGVEIIVYANFSAEDLRIGSEGATPERITDDDAKREAGLSVVGRKDAAELGTSTE
jgi:hypothetical protein